MTMHAIRIYEKLKFYQPLGLLFEPDANMPQGATADLPLCLICQRQSQLPPAKVGWLRADNETRLFQVCGECDCPDDELEKRIVAKITEPDAAEPAVTTVGIDARPAVPAREAKWRLALRLSGFSRWRRPADALLPCSP